jgi:nucleotide-binding universal stress UspA family protein
VTGSKFDQVFEQLREYGRVLLSAAQSSVIDAGIEVDSKLVEISGGDVGERIIEEASAWPADLIVCGTHGRRGLRRIVMGSAAEHVVRLSSVPVLLVPAGAGGS